MTKSQWQMTNCGLDLGEGFGRRAFCAYHHWSFEIGHWSFHPHSTGAAP
jgi:hypothetical protein